jgi:putative transposase
VRFRAIAKLRGIWPLRWLCATFEVTCADFYAWLQRPESERACVDTQLSVAIRRSFSESDRTYGARRVRQDLRHWGHRCGIHRVERLMRREQLVARRRRRRMPFDSGPRPEHSIAPNVLQRQFAAVAATANGWRISRICGPPKAGCTWQS